MPAQGFVHSFSISPSHSAPGNWFFPAWEHWEATTGDPRLLYSLPSWHRECSGQQLPPRCPHDLSFLLQTHPGLGSALIYSPERVQS